MKKAIGLLIPCTLSKLVFAQTVPLGTAMQYRGVGNTLREAEQYVQAKNLLEPVLTATQKANDRYWTAAAYENLGLLARDCNDPMTASFYFRKALEGCMDTGATTSAKVLSRIKRCAGQ